MKNSVILLPNFHARCQEVVKFSLKLSSKLSLTVKVLRKVSIKISRLLDSTRENSARRHIKKSITVYRYISIFSTYRSITSRCITDRSSRRTVCWCVSAANSWPCSSHTRSSSRYGQCRRHVRRWERTSNSQMANSGNEPCRAPSDIAHRGDMSTSNMDRAAMSSSLSL